MRDVELAKLPLREGNQLLEDAKGGLEEETSSSRVKVLQEDDQFLEGKGTSKRKSVLESK